MRQAGSSSWVLPPDHLLRSHGWTVQHSPAVVVSWANVPGLLFWVGSRPPIRQQCWQSRNTGSLEGRGCASLHAPWRSSGADLHDLADTRALCHVYSNRCTIKDVRLYPVEDLFACQPGEGYRYDLPVTAGIPRAGVCRESRPNGRYPPATACRLESVGSHRKNFPGGPTSPGTERRSTATRRAWLLVEPLPGLSRSGRTGGRWVLGSSRPPRLRGRRPMYPYRAHTRAGRCRRQSMACPTSIAPVEDHFVLRTSSVYASRSADQDAYPAPEHQNWFADARPKGGVGLRTATMGIRSHRSAVRGIGSARHCPRDKDPVHGFTSCYWLGWRRQR